MGKEESEKVKVFKIFPDSFLDSLAEDSIVATRMIAERFRDENKRLGSEAKIRDPFYTEYLEAFGIGLCLVDSYKLDVPAITIDGNRLTVDGNRRENIDKIEVFYKNLLHMSELHHVVNTVTIGKGRLASRLKQGFHYEFSDGDFSRIQQLINEVRDLINQSTYIETEHKNRLLKRLEGLQRELHKKVSDLDRFWGIVADAGVALGKFGADAKPILERIRELAFIIGATQLRAEGLPSSCAPPLQLPSPDHNPNHGVPDGIPSVDV